jgi:hypothetical protein
MEPDAALQRLHPARNPVPLTAVPWRTYCRLRSRFPLNRAANPKALSCSLDGYHKKGVL